MTTSTCSSIILSTFTQFRDEIDHHNQRRENLIQLSREITSLSKKLIFHLHRINPSPSSSPSIRSKMLTQAHVKLDEIVSLLETVFQGQQEDSQLLGYRYDRNLGPGLEEMIEAFSFLHFLENGTLVSLQTVQQVFSLRVPVPIHRYLLGISDLTGELMRYATNAVGHGDTTGKVVRQVLDLLRFIVTRLDPFCPFVRDLSKKQVVTIQSVRKMEDVLYAITVRSSEYGQDPQALQEMVRKTLATCSSSSSDVAYDGN